uniref:Uncharacterized protein n=1 Tax=uncultured prokaryote TaxID=198431 RepID=A0A0H5PV24_9ZZZZ|nr:hypothetical protein [uncultured prokaryote]
MTVYRIDAVLPYRTHIPRDVVINTFHVETEGDITETQINAVHGAIPGFYNNVQTTNNVAARMSDFIDREGDFCQTVIREVDVPGAPLDVDYWSLGEPSNDDSLPLEVAICCSYYSLVSGVPRGRTRGRIFLGPWSATAAVIDYPGSLPPNVNSALRADICSAATDLHDALSSYDVIWGVYSRVDEVLYPIEAGYVDDAFDTQRRREVEATTRTTWAPTPVGP